jgi:hypothetical protein
MESGDDGGAGDGQGGTKVKAPVAATAEAPRKSAANVVGNGAADRNGNSGGMTRAQGGARGDTRPDSGGGALPVVEETGVIIHDDD